ncbi:MAG: hypothetical protein JWL63_1430 [Rhodocyclales bacterium]|nr:hypothetical protein [Rhodocyclales bacterium]
MNILKCYKVHMVAALLCVAASAHAETLSGIGSGGATQTKVVCYIYNAGPGAVSVTAKNIYSEVYGTQTIAFDSCSSSVADGAICAFVANITAAVSGNVCTITFSPSAANVRGSMEIRDSSAKVLSNVLLR